MSRLAILSFLWLPFATAQPYIFNPSNLCIVQASEDAIANGVKIRLYDETTDQYTEEPADDPLPFIGEIDLTKETVLIISGWTGELFINRVPTVALLDAFLHHEDRNVLEINWHAIAFNEYFYVACSIEDVGRFVAVGLNKLIAAGLSPALLHIVGHSLGAQIAGHIGRNVNFRVQRITGLDPAGPGFGDYLLEYLTHQDAVFVDIIHSNAGLLGINLESGSVDFHPNGGGLIQPGCEISIPGCSHFRADYFFAESVKNETAFTGRECDSYGQFNAGNCDTNPTAVMGLATPITTRGNFYLKTNSQSPFGRGINGADSLG